MKIQRTRKTITGTVWGVIEKLSNLLLPFLIRTILIKKLGTEYLGLNSLYTSIFQVINLTELGFGTAVTFALYKPIAEHDVKTICGIVTYLRNIYRKIGKAILLIGLLILPFISFTITGSVPNDVNIYILYIIYLLNNVVTYFMFAHKTTLLSALQCNDVISKIGFITSTALKLFQIGVLFIIPNFYVYTLLIPVFTIINNVLLSKIVDKNYSEFTNIKALDDKYKKQIKEKIFPLMSTKAATVIIGAADTLVISSFLGLNDVAMYNNYSYIVSSLMGFIFVIYNAMQPGIGNILVSETKENIKKTFNNLFFINNWLVIVCTACFLCLCQNFIKLWLGSNMVLPTGILILFCAYFYANMSQRIIIVYKDAAGIWKEDMLRCYIGCALNLIVNIITVNFIGLYGVIGSTVLSNILILPLMGKILYKNVFKESSKELYKKEFLFMLCAIAICTICYIFTAHISNTIQGLLLKGFVCFIISNLLLFILYFKTKSYKDSKQFIFEKIIRKGR